MISWGELLLFQRIIIKFVIDHCRPSSWHKDEATYKYVSVDNVVEQPQKHVRPSDVQSTQFGVPVQAPAVVHVLPEQLAAKFEQP